MEEISSYIRNNLDQVQTYYSQPPVQQVQEAKPPPPPVEKPKEKPKKGKSFPMVCVNKSNLIN